ncbi:PREDICTED: ethanolamine kinase 1 [Dinoponera quadriceps]|uniref:ethanolamine kinase n=1 Tax=Dinoponera quadriceps TaxID=609295 RepID=A0A6P3XQU9_DINQU|nr:PREDICTED: ethanolamine kinase 1 [Dinoponera quadriceps]
MDACEQHLDITIDENEIFDGVKGVIKKIRPSWPLQQLHFKTFTNGISNKLVGVWHLDRYTDMVLTRIYGNNTDLLVDRKKELENIRILHKAGYTHCIYATFNNGFAYQFLEGDTLTVEAVRDPQVYPLIARRLAEMHKVENENIPKEAFIWEKMEKYMEIMPRKFSDSLKQTKFEILIQPYAVLEKEYQILKEELSTLDSPVVYAHNDLLLTNILYNRRKKSVAFIDYEYTAFNYQAFDIANHFAEYAGLEPVPNYSLYPDKEFQKVWLREYLRTYNATSEVSEEEVDKLYQEVAKFSPFPHFFWGCWSLIQSMHSTIDFDFLEYAAARFNEYFRRKEDISELKIDNE